MTVNIAKNALNSNVSGNINGKGSTRQILNKLSSGISLPQEKSGSTESPVTDSTEVSSNALNKAAESGTGLNNITSLQEEVSRLDTVQTSLESISSDLWELGKEITASREVTSTEAETAETAAVETAPEESSQTSEDLQQITSSYLEGIDHTGSELMDYIGKFMESYSLNVDLSLTGLGQIDETSSLAALTDESVLNSDKADSIISKAQGEIAELQVTTEMQRNNLLNDISSELTSATSNLEEPNIDEAMGYSLREISDLLLSTPEAISDYSQIDIVQASNLLLS